MRDWARPAGRRERLVTRIDRALCSFFWGLRSVPLSSRPFFPLSSPTLLLSLRFPLLPNSLLLRNFLFCYVFQHHFSADLATFCSGVKYNGTVDSGASYLVKIEVKGKGRSKATACSWMYISNDQS